MEQKKIGIFLKDLRKEKGLTQEQLAEKFNVSNRTVSRWETGANMPDISVLAELSEFYQISIDEIIDGERKTNNVNESINTTIVKVAEYAKEDKKIQYYKMRGIIGSILSGFGFFLIISVLAIFPRDSSWGSVYSIIGAIILSAGAYQLMCKNKYKVIVSFCCFAVLLCCLVFTDYVGVLQGNQVPRFAYEKIWSEDSIIFKAPFYTVVWYDYDTENEYIKVIR